MLHDLRAVNTIIQPKRVLQPGLPSPAIIPSTWPIIVIDIKDCFFTIPLAEQDKESFTFSVPLTNNQEPLSRYQWRVLPQGMISSPTICQYFI